MNADPFDLDFLLDDMEREVVLAPDAINAVEHVFPLNAGQEAALAKLRDFLAGDAQFFGLYGYAGTGKTTVIQRLFDGGSANVVMSAPTHKACGVLAEMAGEAGLAWMPVATIHSLCSVKPFRVDGERVFKPDPRKPAPIRNFSVVVIDECSMVSTEMWSWVTSTIRPSTKVIVMGDPLQLPPVGEGESPCFDMEYSATLTEIVRSRGVVQDAATRIRLNIGSRVPMLAQTGRDEHGSIERVESNEWLAEFLAAVSKPGNRAKALAFTNDAVDWLNGWVREQLYGQNPAPFIAGERLVLVESHEIGATMLHTETELEVERAMEWNEFELDCWRLDVVDHYGWKGYILALDDEQRPAWVDRVNRAKAKGRALNQWDEYYRLKEAFARVRPGWATTIHKSQGSTYDEVFLVETEVVRKAKRDHSFRNMLLYVGYSRARRRLCLS
jgi:exodeoxyribonuclease-5